MKILIISTSEYQGGAARAAWRLHQSLLATGIESNMLVQSKQSNDYTVIGPITKVERMKGIIRPSMEQFFVKGKNNSGNLFSVARLTNKKVLKLIDEINPDVINIHWFQNGCLSIEDLSKIRKPIIFTLHDNWLYTGGCHITWGCTKFIDGCSCCQYMKKAGKRDLSHKTFVRKNKIFHNLNSGIIALSNYVLKDVEKSYLLKDKKKYHLPNTLNTDIFKVLSKDFINTYFNTDSSKKKILFGAMNPLKDFNKGADLLFKALSLFDVDDFEIYVIGASKTKESYLKQKTHYLGFLQDEYSLSLVYNLADITIVPSRQENLSNMIMESLACGTPVLGFDVGGNQDLVKHKENGYLARPLDVEDLANGLRYLLNQKLSRDAISSNIRNCYSYDVIGKKMLTVIEDFLSEN